MKARRVAAGVVAACAVLAGCQSTVPGDPLAGSQNPTEPDFPTTRPSRTTPTTTSTLPAPPTVVSPPTAPEVLTPQNGYVFIETTSGQTRCQISVADVGCEAPFANPPVVDGFPANGVQVSAGGQLKWIVGNLGDIPVVTLDYRTYSAEGWTIVATETGTRFTNDASSRGMFVSIEEVDAF